VLDPIRAAVSRGLEQFAKRHGIDLVLDRSQLGEAVLIAAPGVDITDAFIKDYNTNASPTRKQKSP
jgi:Skp family chaperone for outer membrane proteins